MDDNELPIPDWSDDDDKWAIRVIDNEMEADHIVEGDYVVVQRITGQPPFDGTILAIRDDAGEVVLRRVSKAPLCRYSIQGSSSKTASLIRSSVDVVGRLVGVVRRY